MATLSNPVFYNNGVGGANAVVGFESSVNRVVRYTLTLASGESANHINFSIAESDLNHIAWGDGTSRYLINDSISLYFAVSTDPDKYANAGFDNISSAAGKVALDVVRGTISAGDASFEAKGEADFNILSGTTYYLWIFPGYSSGGNNVWGWFSWGKYLDVTVILSGSAGQISIGDLTGIPEVFHAGQWVQVIPDVFTAGAWKTGVG